MTQLSASFTAPWKLAVSCFSHLENRAMPAGSPQRTMVQISAQSCKHLLSTQPERLILVDVRHPDEYAQGALPGSILLPFTEIQAGAGIVVVQHLVADNPNSQLIVICTAGVRSAKALALLQQVGVSGWNLQGGLNAWKQEFGAFSI